MKAVSARCGVETVAVGAVEGLAPEPDSAAERLVRRLTGSNAPSSAVSFGTEAGLFQRGGVPTVVCGPGSILQAHAADIALFDTFAGRRDALTRAARMAEEGVVDHIELYTWDAAPKFVEAAQAMGAAAVVLKSVGGGHLVEQLERVADGERIGLADQSRTNGRNHGEALSLREQEVLALLALGLSVNFFLYVFINIAMVTGIFPVVGVPLPLISYGGTAMLTLMFGFGLVLSVYINRDARIGRFDDEI